MSHCLLTSRWASRLPMALMPASVGWLALLLLAALLGLPTRLSAAEKNGRETKAAAASAADLEFFEKQVRPILAEHCYKCHSARAKELQGGLRVDSRQALLTGGDTGPAITPGRPEESLLIDAVRHGDIYQMPPDSKLPAETIASLTRWVARGAPWPEEKEVAHAAAEPEFDLASRKAEHWAWQPITDPPLPAVKQTRWPRSTIDRFILARLEQEGLAPAERADRSLLLRRVHFDLIGLPPSVDEVKAFLSDDAPDAYRRVVDRLLASPRFGERWARHWLDLVRYAESRGHEFDADAPNAFEYRDYVIRAFNEDVPYDQFVREHIAGDLVEPPRRNRSEGFNESIIGTGFWFLGEWVHSPVSIRQDETDRFDNMLDVATKTFLGMTVGCARCHDHKFDAISQRDYYALAGYLQSSNYRLARFETDDHNRGVAEALARFRAQSRQELGRAWQQAAQPALSRLKDYLLAARRALATLPAATAPDLREDIVLADFESGTYSGWEVSGEAFGEQPMSQATLPEHQGDVGAEGKYFVNSHRGNDRLTGRMRSHPFTIERPFVHLLIGGGAHRDKTCVNLLVDNRRVATLSGRNNNRMHAAAWDVSKWQGKLAELEIVDNHSGGWGNIGVDPIVQSDRAGEQAAADRPLSPRQRKYVEGVAAAERLNGQLLCQWVGHLQAAEDQPSDPFYIWAKLAQASADGHLPAGQLTDLCRTAAGEFAPASQHGASGGVIFDFGQAAEGTWMPDGPSFGVSPVRSGTLLLGDTPEDVISGVAAYSAARRDPVFEVLKLRDPAENDFGRLGATVRAGKMIRTPTFTVEQGPVYYLVAGSGRVYAAMDSHRLNNGPLHGELVGQWKDLEQPRWQRLNLSRYRGHRTHLEFSAEAQGPCILLKVAQGPSPPADPWPDFAQLRQLLASEPEGIEQLAARYQDLCRGAVTRLAAAESSQENFTSTQAALADWLVRHEDLLVDPQAEVSEQLRATVKKYLARLADLKGQIKPASRLCMAMMDGSAEDEQLLIRGNYKTPGERVPRRLLEALDGCPPPSDQRGSGRLQLARQIASPDNPLTARVAVNRIWHHLFGRGLVASVDNFGVLGERPSHPALLDHLARRFLAGQWSQKKLIREIVLSETYQMAAVSWSPAGRRIDPANHLLHRMRVRRMEGEVLRDWILAVSGRLDRRMFGPSVPVQLTAFMQGRGRPRQQGPLDGDGRRSIYIAVRRNFLSPMMLAFDTPIPFTTIGRRNVSNVPAQALILMNDPLVIEQAQRWSQKLGRRAQQSPAERVQQMYLAALGRAARSDEVTAAIEFLETQGQEYGIPPQDVFVDPRPWADLGHVLWNTKEFFFVH